MKREKMFLSIVIASILQVAHAEEINPAELKIFAAQRFHINYDTQNEKTKSDVTAQYQKHLKLSQKLRKNAMKDDIDLKVASQLLTVDIWAKKYLLNAKVSDEKLHEMYTQLKPMVNPQYKLRSILLKDENQADALLKNSTSDNMAQEMDTFAQNNQLKVFVSEFLDANKLDSTMQQLLGSRNKGEVFKYQTPNKQWQVIWIENLNPSHPATFEESKERLTLIAKQKMLDEEITKIIGK